MEFWGNNWEASFPRVSSIKNNTHRRIDQVSDSASPFVHPDQVQDSPPARVQAGHLEMLNKRVVEVIQNKSSPGFYSRLFTVLKPSGVLRLIIDLLMLNAYLEVLHFKTETLVYWSVCQTGRVDDQRGFVRCVPSCTTSRALPFGLATALREFFRLLLPILN